MDLSKRARWLRGVAGHVSSQELALLLGHIADAMADRQRAGADPPFLWPAYEAEFSVPRTDGPTIDSHVAPSK